jgi:cyclomaltodextrinase / maltogenic alpha-amylase / neopullulanase
MNQPAIFYHIYPLGFCGAPHTNDFNASPVPRLEKIHTWLDHIQSLGCNALYLGPVFESSAHGYDTSDYYWVDRRLGTNETLAWLSADLHRRGMRLVLDGVFNHVGRHFWAFRDVQARGWDSPYRDWFTNLRFDGRSPYGDPFQYEGWNGHYDLVRLNLAHPEVREHLFNAIAAWTRDFDIDGLRLDTADCLDFDFLHALSNFCHSLKPDFWLIGEVIHGDYRRWVNSNTLDSVTNYECYKGLYSSHNDSNYFEIAYAINRQSGQGGLYSGLDLYNFADNHDVDRVASRLANPDYQVPLYHVLLGMPGIPSFYYGSEWGLRGQRTPSSDRPLRPNLDLNDLCQRPPQRGLAELIASLAHLRLNSPALARGDYQQLWVSSQQFAFLRQTPNERVVVAVNASSQAVDLALRLPMENCVLRDMANGRDRFYVNSVAGIVHLLPFSGRFLRVE